MSPEAATEQDLAVLREMVRLAEQRREEELQTLDRVNKYNLALIAFSGSFLSLLITAHIDIVIVQFAGLCLIGSILASLFAVRPATVKGGSIAIDSDITSAKSGVIIDQSTFLLETADITEQAGMKLALFARRKKRLTIISAIFLAIALISTYILYAYATTR